MPPDLAGPSVSADYTILDRDFQHYLAKESFDAGVIQFLFVLAKDLRPPTQVFGRRGSGIDWRVVAFGGLLSEPDTTLGVRCG